ncbi:hypothetical protein [Modestobacter sp. URMC 112]
MQGVPGVPGVADPTAAGTAAGATTAAPPAGGGTLTIDQLVVGAITAGSVTIANSAPGTTAAGTTTAPGTTAAGTTSSAPSTTAGSTSAAAGSTSSSSTSRSSTSSTSATSTSSAPATVAAVAPQTNAGAGMLASVASLPTSGTAWTTLLSAANDQSGGVDLVNQDNTHSARTLAAALVYARTGDAAQRAAVVSSLQRLPGASLSGARALSVGRQLGGYAIAADLVGYRDAAFRSWIGGMRTKDFGNHGRWVTLTGTSEDSPSNWGAWAMASRIAISAYLGDTTDLHRAAVVFRGFVGDRGSYAGFRHTNAYDPAWSCGEATWTPINAACGAKGGAIVEDISRSGAYPSIDATGLTYSWEVLGGATMSARLLERAGYTDVWSWGNKGLLRAATFLRDNGGYAPRYSVNQYIPHEINAAYGVSLGPVASKAGFGRQFGFSDWLG